VKWDDRIGRRLKLHDLHVLLMVVEVDSMGKAAEQLALSQPSVSKAIADIEHAVGVRFETQCSQACADCVNAAASAAMLLHEVVREDDA
jgi:hypothetical protein